MRTLLTAVLLLTVAVLAFRSAATESPASGDPLATSTISISFAGLQGTAGYLVIMLYDDPGAFARYSEDAIAFGAVPAASEAAVSFHGLPHGRYAVRAFHDEDGDGDLNIDEGYPLEGYATSGASGRFDDPDFDEAAITGSAVELTLYYLN